MARADPSFTLSRTDAASGETVGFNISGTESSASYVLEIDGEEAAEGSVPAGGGPGAFTMPDLGSANRSVTVEIQIEQGDETTSRARNLHYLVSPPPGPVAAAPVAAAPADQPAQVSLSQKQPQATPAKRKARRSPGSAPRRHAAGRPGSGFQRSGGRAIRATTHRAVSAPRRTAGPAGRRSAGKQPALPASRPTSPRKPPRANAREFTVSSLLRSVTPVPATAALASVASGVTDSGINDGGFPITAITVLSLLGLGALVLAGGPSAPTYRRRRSVRPRPSRVAGTRAAAGTPAPQNRPTVSNTESRALVDAAAATFSPISLAVVEQRAGLASRSERKFIFDMETFERLISALGPDYEILEIDDQRIFPYDSVYFDSPGLIVYRHHVQGRRKRFKSRTRLYSEAGPCYFELKCKGGRGQTVKRRFEAEVEAHGLLTSEGLAFLERELEAYGASLPPSLRPGLRTLYRRLTLVNRMDTERLTFDFELAFSLNGDRHSIRPGMVLLETKMGMGASGSHAGPGNSDAARPQAKRVLRRLGVRPVQSCSKYCIGVALTHPDIQDNPFRRLIRNYFDPSWRPRGTAPPPDSPAPRAEYEQDGSVVPHEGLQEGPA